MADERPIFSGNDAGLMLLERMAGDLAKLAEAVSKLQTDAARNEGLNLDMRLRELGADFKALDKRMDAVETHQQAADAQARPWRFLVGEAAKVLLAAGTGFAAAWFGTHPHGH